MTEKVTYTRNGDFFLPELSVPEKEYEIGKYGMLKRAYLKNHLRSVYSMLFTSGRLFDHLLEVDKTCRRCLQDMISKMVKQEGVTEDLKVTNQMEWVRRINLIHNRAEEFIMDEYVYEGFVK